MSHLRAVFVSGHESQNLLHHSGLVVMAQTTDVWERGEREGEREKERDTETERERHRDRERINTYISHFTSPPVSVPLV